MTTRTLVLSEHDLDAWAARAARGEVPARLPYGVDALESLGYRLAGVPATSGRVLGKLRDVAEHRSGLRLERALRGAARAARADLVLALLEPQGRVAGMLRGAGIPPYRGRPLVVWSVWLAEELRSAAPADRRRLVRGLLAADLLTHMSRHETEVLVDAGFSPDRLLRVDFGVEDAYYTPDPSITRDLPVLAVGQDRGRDWATLYAAVPRMGAPVVLHAPQGSLPAGAPPPGLELGGVIPLPEYRNRLRRAQVVVVPTHDLAYPTGQSVALEAAATGACVVATDTAAMRQYLTHDDTALLVPPGDPVALAGAVDRALGDDALRARLGAAAHASVRGRFSSRHMWAAVDRALHERGVLRG